MVLGTVDGISHLGGRLRQSRSRSVPANLRFWEAWQRSFNKLRAVDRPLMADRRIVETDGPRQRDCDIREA
jgi:hypothetical protein